MRKIGRFFFIFICLFLLSGSMTDLLPKASAASEMAASESCVEFIKEVEGFSPQPYYDYNQYTVGYGTKCPTEKYFDYTANGIPKKEAEALLRDFLAEIGNTINEKLIDKYNLTVSQHQFDALVSFSFNIGTGWMTYDSSLRNAILSNGSDNDMVYAFGLYCTAGGKYLPGLITRRLCEANMFLNGVYSQKINDAYGYVYYDATGGTLTYRVQGYICNNGTAPVSDATREGDVFLGWYTNLTGGSLVNVLDRDIRGKTLFARWQSSENTDDLSPSSTVVRVTGDVVNVRSGPGTNYGVIKKVYQNDILTISHITHITTMMWGKIQDGWICLDYTNYNDVINGTDTDVPDKAPTPEEQNPADTLLPPEDLNYITGIVKVNDALRIRSGPGTAYTTVGFLFNGKEVDILEQKAVGNTVWGRISKGWVCMDYIVTDEFYDDTNFQPDMDYTPEEPDQDEPVYTEPEPENNENTNVESAVMKGIVIADALRIRAAAGTSNRIVGFYYQNDTVVITERIQIDSVYWGKTDKGWVNMEYISSDSYEEDSIKPTYGNAMTVIGDCLRIRKNPGTDQKIAALLYYGDSVVVYETIDVDGTVWGRVDNGWICMDYVS